MLKKRILSLILSAALVLGVVTSGLWASSPLAGAAGAPALSDTINAVSGLSASVSGSVVTVSGSANRTANLPLNIDAGVTVIWNAALTGSAAANNYLLTLSGGGTFTLGGGSLNLTSGAGGTVYIAGGVTLNVTGGSIETSGAGSAVTVAAGTLGAVVNVSGGTISSVPNGYAINDGSGMAASDNNTRINISSGLVESGSACAVRSTGIASVVTVSGGEVRNNAASNPNSVIYMNYAPAPNNGLDNIVVSGGLVRTLNAGSQSYVLQSSQNILISGGKVQALAGRAVNLVGERSVAKVTGGRVSTVSGTAVSTATTTLDEVNYAKVEISGGIVEATGTGKAVVITGYNSTAVISGSAKALAKSGLAIDASGRPAADSVRVNGGFVFAWGSAVTGAANVINPAAKLNPAVGGVVAAWNTATGIGPAPYIQGERNELSMLPANSVYWDKNPDSAAYTDGIRYANGSTAGFHTLNVTVIQMYFILTVNDGGGTPVSTLQKAGDVVGVTAGPGEAVNPLLTPPSQYPVNGSVFKGWTTDNGGAFDDASAQVAAFTMPNNDVTVTATYSPRYLLHVIGGNIVLADRNYGGSASYGYYAAGDTVNLAGNASFAEWQTTSGGVFANNLAVNTAFTMPAREAMVQGVTGTYVRPTKPEYTTTVIDGTILETSAGTPVNAAAYTGYAGTGLKIQARALAGDEVFSHWEVSGSGLLENPYAPDTMFIMLGNATVEAIFEPLFTLTVNGEAKGKYRAGELISLAATLAPAGKSFTGWTADAGTFDHADSPSAVFTMPAGNAAVTAHYDAIPYVLTVVGGTGGGTYPYGAAVAATADPAPAGQKFVGWDATGIALTDAAKPAQAFSMPAGDVTLAAKYEPILYTLTVVNGVAAGGTQGNTYAAGETVAIKADDKPGKKFVGWTGGSGGSFADSGSANTTFTMPAADAAVTAVYEDLPAGSSVSWLTLLPIAALLPFLPAIPLTSLLSAIPLASSILPMLQLILAKPQADSPAKPSATEKAPKTGDDLLIVPLMLGLMGVAFAGAAVMLERKRKEEGYQ
ncbi:MAG: InlB B-repeat-containing protein [Firmicutes bacterium]|nr:InlB B-repeat-containing protein [Bacillota bacterium]